MKGQDTGQGGKWKRHDTGQGSARDKTLARVKSGIDKIDICRVQDGTRLWPEWKVEETRHWPGTRYWPKWKVEGTRH